jgi:magnesium transporter
MRGTLTSGDGTMLDATAAAVEQALAGGAFFWLDLNVPGPEPDPELKDLLLDTFHFHPLAVDASDHFGQRARIDDYGDFVNVVTFGVGEDGRSVAEVHCFLTTQFIVSIHRGDCPALADVRARLATHHSAGAAPPQLVIFYLIMDGLIDSFFPVLAQFDDEIDELESAILKTPTEAQLGVIFDMKRQILAIRKVVTPQRDMIATLNAGMVSLPGMTDSGTAYFRSLYDHLIRISDMVDSYRDLLTGAMDTHLSMVNNRLNLVMKQLAIIATIFLPLSFLTGFFGQNFNWTINNWQHSGLDFVLVGVVPEVIAIALLLWLFRRRGWLGTGPTA